MSQLSSHINSTLHNKMCSVIEDFMEFKSARKVFYI